MHEEADVGTPRTCPGCGAVALGGTAFCGSCGRALGGRAGRKSGSLVWTLSAVALLILLGAVAFFAYSRVQGDSREVAAMKNKLNCERLLAGQPSPTSTDKSEGQSSLASCAIRALAQDTVDAANGKERQYPKLNAIVVLQCVGNFGGQQQEQKLAECLRVFGV